MRTLYFHPIVSFFLSSSFFLSFSFPCLISAVADCMSPYFHTWCGLSANLGSRSETCCAQLAENTRCSATKLWCAQMANFYIFATKACVDNWKKDLLNGNICPTCPPAPLYPLQDFKALYKCCIIIIIIIQYGELWPTSGWDRFVSFGHPS